MISSFVLYKIISKINTTRHEKMSADICSDVTQTVGKDNISASVNPDNQSLSTTHEKTFIPNNIGIKYLIGYKCYMESR